MHGGANQTANSSDKAGVLNSAGRLEKLRRDRADLRVLQRLDHILNPVTLLGFNVVIQKNEAFAGSHLRARIAFCRKIEWRVERNQTHFR